MDLNNLLNTVVNQNTLGGIILAAFFVMVGILLRGVLTNNGNIAVARINSESTLGAKAMETLTTALEVLRDENASLKAHKIELESHIETLIEYVLILVKARSQEEVDKAVAQLENFLRSIGRWPK